VQLRRPGIQILAAVHLVLAAPALAAKPAPAVWELPAGPTGGAPGGAVTSGACVSGITGSPSIVFAYVEPPDDAYYTLITPAPCAGCATGARMLTTAHALLYFTTSCQVPVQVSIVPAQDLGEGCVAPDLVAAPICETVTYMVGAVTLNQCVDYAFPLPPGACLDGPAFLRLEFDEGSCPNYLPGFCGLSTCSACTQYNVYPGVAGDHGRDLCSEVGKAAMMSVESTCCAATPIAPGTWGRLKSLYR
jgi:hypothetical protein